MADKEKQKQEQMRKLKKDLASAEEQEDDVCFVRSGRDAGQGLSLKLGDAEDETSSEEEAAAPGMFVAFYEVTLSNLVLLCHILLFQRKTKKNLFVKYSTRKQQRGKKKQILLLLPND